MIKKEYEIVYGLCLSSFKAKFGEMIRLLQKGHPCAYYLILTHEKNGIVCRKVCDYVCPNNSMYNLIELR